MLLQRKLIKKLDDYNLNHDEGISRQQLVDSITKLKIWPYCFWYGQERFRRKINTVLGDSIRGEYDYIAEDDDRESLVVTTRGREFIKLPFGFFEEVLKRRRRTSHFLFGGAIFSTLTGLVVHFWPLIISKLGF